MCENKDINNLEQRYLYDAGVSAIARVHDSGKKTFNPAPPKPDSSVAYLQLLITNPVNKQPMQKGKTRDHFLDPDARDGNGKPRPMVLQAGTTLLTSRQRWVSKR